MDGLTAIRKLREFEQGTSRRPLPALAVTGNAREAQIEACKRAGFDDVVVKPCTSKTDGIASGLRSTKELSYRFNRRIGVADPCQIGVMPAVSCSIRFDRGASA